MDTNGADEYAPLAARVAQLEAANALLARRVETQLIERVLALEEEVAGQREALTALAEALAAERRPRA